MQKSKCEEKVKKRERKRQRLLALVCLEEIACVYVYVCVNVCVNVCVYFMKY